MDRGSRLGSRGADEVRIQAGKFTSAHGRQGQGDISALQLIESHAQVPDGDRNAKSSGSPHAHPR